ncbi:GSCOCG00003834001-RA-CDS [Cotesia congregata]|nr:GSCOCG00003834001-RA-CDS [Cotesia congregata]
MAKPVLTFTIHYLIVVVIVICTTLADYQEKDHSSKDKRASNNGSHAENHTIANKNGLLSVAKNNFSSNNSDVFNDTKVTKDKDGAHISKIAGDTFANESVSNQTKLVKNKDGSTIIEESVKTVDTNHTDVTKTEKVLNADGGITDKETKINKSKNRTTDDKTHLIQNKDGTATVESVITITDDNTTTTNQTGVTNNKYGTSIMDPHITVEHDKETTVYKTDVTKNKDGTTTVDEFVIITTKYSKIIHHIVKRKYANGYIKIITDTVTRNCITYNCNQKFSGPLRDACNKHVPI